jgi:hypothetical protein
MDIAEIEYVYRYSDGADGQFEFRWIAYRIAKRTKAYVFVVIRPPLEDVNILTGEPVSIPMQCIKLDRAELERAGCVYSRQRREFFYSAEGMADRVREWATAAATHKAERFATLRAPLGLAGEFTATDVRSAFNRLALKAQPDHGGTNEAFRNLIAARDAALAVREDALRRGELSLASELFDAEAELDRELQRRCWRAMRKPARPPTKQAT